MTSRVSVAVVLALAGFAAETSHAQTYGAPYSGQPPLYPYAVQQPYAVEVAPNTYVIQRPAQTRGYPTITCINCSRNSSDIAPEPSAPAFDRPHKPADRALIEELRKREGVKQTVINTKKIVREKPIVHVTTRVVEDPPRVIERRHVVDELPQPPARYQAPAGESSKSGKSKSADSDKRVIDADAEITILGPDRMSIRLIRKRGEPQAKAQPGE